MERSPEHSSATVELPTREFDPQFNFRHKSKTKNGTFEYAHITPEKPVGLPLIFHPGWLGDIKACEQISKEAYDLNQEIYIPDLIIHSPPKVKGQSYDAYTLRNAQALAQIVKENDLKRVNLVGHSEGTSVSLTAAQLLLDKGVEVENILLINPTGFGLNRERGIRAKTELVRRGVKVFWQEFLRNRNNEVDLPQISLPKKHIFRHPLHIAREGVAIANVDMEKLLEEVISQGVKVSVLQAEDDPFVRHEDLNTEIQLAAQIIRQAEIEKVLAENKNLRDNDKQRILSERVKELDREESQRIITTAIGKPGHIFSGHYPKTFMQTAIPLLNRKAVE